MTTAADRESMPSTRCDDDLSFEMALADLTWNPLLLAVKI
jgi:hypothetical protein